MNRKPIMALILSFAMLLSVVYPVTAPEDARAATVKLNKTSISIRVKKSKTIKMTGTYHTVSWSISSGKANIKLKNYKKNKITIVGKKQGKGTVKGTIWYSAKKKKVLKCKVTVKPPLWQCPRCGMSNDTNFCSNCGQKKPDPSASPTPTPNGSASPTASSSPTPTPISPEAMSDKSIVMVLNNSFPFKIQLYANSAAMTFYDRVCKQQISNLTMGPDGENEKCCHISPGINTYISESYHVAKGEVFLYGIDVLKISANEHDTGAFPTRIGRVTDEYVYMLDQALVKLIDGKTVVQFKQYI